MHFAKRTNERMKERDREREGDIQYPKTYRLTLFSFDQHHDTVSINIHIYHAYREQRTAHISYQNIAGNDSSERNGKSATKYV